MLLGRILSHARKAGGIVMRDEATDTYLIARMCARHMSSENVQVWSAGTALHTVQEEDSEMPQYLSLPTVQV
jgi:hypothetical protein